ncbi:uncharacterized protein [Pleurodeles waltl]|uniref:uncharacterized protein isoform X1 n=1 Tax=Pleurodeles waltl TaxID=8319 RepID=UPI003709C5B6
MMNSPAALALLPVWFLLACALSLPHAPQKVRLVSEDFYSNLTWTLDTTSASSEFEVQIYASGSEYVLNWTRVNATCERMNVSWRCDLSSYFHDLYISYGARVRTVQGGATSNWTMSNELNHYRDVTLGPPEMELRVRGQELQVVVGTRLTPFRGKRVHELLRKIKCNISLYEGPRQVDHDPLPLCSERLPYRYSRSLKGDTLYCVHVQITFHNRKISRSRKCIKTSPEPPDLLSLGLILGCVVVALIMLGSPALLFIIRSVHPDSAKMRTPKTLQIVLNDDSKVVFWSSGPDESLKVDFIALDAIVEPVPEGMSEAEGETHVLHPLPGEYDFQHDHGYRSCSVPDSSEKEAYLGASFSWSSSQEGLGAAGQWEDYGSSDSDPIDSDSVPVCPARPSSSKEVNGGCTVHLTGTQGPKPTSQEKAEDAVYRGAGKAQQCPLDIPLDSVQLQASLGPLDEKALGDFFDSGSDESTEDNSLDSKSVTTGQEDESLLPYGQASEDVNICGYRSQDQPCSGYEARANAVSVPPASQNEVSAYFQRPKSSVVIGAPDSRSSDYDTEESGGFLRNT